VIAISVAKPELNRKKRLRDALRNYLSLDVTVWRSQAQACISASMRGLSRKCLPIPSLRFVYSESGLPVDRKTDDMRMTRLVIPSCLYTRHSNNPSCGLCGCVLRRQRCCLRAVWQNKVPAQRFLMIEDHSSPCCRLYIGPLLSSPVQNEGCFAPR